MKVFVDTNVRNTGTDTVSRMKIVNLSRKRERKTYSF